MAQQPYVSVVIPGYRRPEGVLLLLRDLVRQEAVSFEIIVVDDCCPDGTARIVESEFPQVRVIRNSVNLGPAVARNRGICAAQGSLIVGFDSDVNVPDIRLLQKVVAVFDRMPDTAGVAFRLLRPDGISDDVARWWHPVPVEHCADKEFVSSYFSGTGYAFRRDAVISAGLFPEVLFMHYEEVGLALRIFDNGGRIVYCPELTVVHNEGKIARRSEVKVFYKPRNQVLATLLYYPLIRGMNYLLPRLGYSLLTALYRGHPVQFCRAMYSAIRLAPACLRERKCVKGETLRRMSALRKRNRWCCRRNGAKGYTPTKSGSCIDSRVSLPPTRDGLSD